MADVFNRTTPVRHCAIYTRVSSDSGLDQDFNSLDNQREAAEAFIKSQSHEGWKLIARQYDDGGYSGGSIDRPALAELLEDVRRGKIDIVVVYKVDRLTRSLADFAKLVELFDAHQVSFVSVTQAFNTTNSMGRLTLNVLLSFAQFEREVTGERIRDKIAASKRKGMWMGGVVPFGYRVENRKLIVNTEEAVAVRRIFDQYLELGTTPALVAALRNEGFRTRKRNFSGGGKIGGGEITRGALTAMLRNRIYIGDIPHKGHTYPGEHHPIVEPSVFARVQRSLDDNRNSTSRKRRDSGALLKGKIFDHKGRAMTPTYASKEQARYRYYVSIQKNGDKTDLMRLPAYDIEQLVIRAVEARHQHLTADSAMPSTVLSPVKTTDANCGDDDVIKRHLHRVTCGADVAELMIKFGDSAPETLRVPLERKRRNKREIISATPKLAIQKPIRAEARARLLYTIARAREWFNGLINSTFQSTEEIAAMEGCSERSVRMILPLAFLSPVIVRAAIEGKMAHGSGISSLSAVEMGWANQLQL